MNPMLGLDKLKEKLEAQAADNELLQKVYDYIKTNTESNSLLEKVKNYNKN